jgi:hypothetical protein
VNRNTTAEASVEEISGVAFIFNQKFFLDLKEETGQFINLKLTCIHLIYSGRTRTGPCSLRREKKHKQSTGNAHRNTHPVKPNKELD